MAEQAVGASRLLDFDAKQDVKYAVPLWLRDEQIKAAIARIPGRIAPGEATQEPVAIVGFGTSLKTTWEQIRQFKRVISCSGSHQFLIERGIIPTWHVEVDPRPHKIKLLGKPHPDVTYLAASACCPTYFDHLDGFNVQLWHVFDPSDDGIRQLPPGEWAVTGGCDVGLRALTIAAFLGYRDLHVFGMDGNAPAEDGERHAAFHPNGKQKYAQTEYPKGSGSLWWTTPAMLEAARSVPHELNQMPTVRVQFYGEGLIQTMMRDWKPKPLADKSLMNIIAYRNPELISAAYRDLNVSLHKTNLAYGVGGGKWAPTIVKLAEKIGSHSVLDYGCGKGYLAKAMPWPIWEYDPAIPEKSAAPRPADIVVCTDVLEHIEPEMLDYVLADLHRVTLRLGWFVIHTGPARKTLPDGRNTHLIQEGEKWWRKMLQRRFNVGLMKQVGPELHVVVEPKKRGK